MVGAAVITLSVIALPQMLEAGYDRRLAIGTIASAGTLGILIPPAIMLVVMAEMLSTSAGNLFLSAVMPGFLLSGLYLVYIIVVAIFKPGAAPKLPPDYGPQSAGEFWTALWRGLFPMTALLVVVLGSIFAGWATPTESGAVGVPGSMFIAALNKRLTIKMLIGAIFDSCRANGVVFMIFLGDGILLRVSCPGRRRRHAGGLPRIGRGPCGALGRAARVGSGGAGTLGRGAARSWPWQAHSPGAASIRLAG